MSNRELIGRAILVALDSTCKNADVAEAGRVLARAALEPINMVLHCPKCGHQHIDGTEPARGAMHYDELPGGMNEWTNPPHRSHLCHACGCIWRPADVPTNGVQSIQTRGKADTYP